MNELVRVQTEGEAIVRNKLVPETEVSFNVENRRPPFSRNAPSENLAAVATRIYGELDKPLKTGMMRFGTDASYAWNPNNPRPAVLETMGLDPPLYASGATRQVAYRLDGKQGMVSGNRRPCFEGHGPQRGQSPLLSQLQQIVCGADNAPFRLHLFEAP